MTDRLFGTQLRTDVSLDLEGELRMGILVDGHEREGEILVRIENLKLWQPAGAEPIEVR